MGDLEIEDRAMRTPLQLAALSGSVGIFKMLLERGANLHHRSEKTKVDSQKYNIFAGFTALHFAVFGGKPQIIKLLLAYAASKGKDEFIKVLEAKDGYDRNALTLARFLVDQGSNSRGIATDHNRKPLLF